jgi:hypothetical protein
MHCPEVQDWLLQADDPRPESCGSAKIAEHLGRCEACRLVAQQLTELEQAWRAMPLPPGAEQARTAFLARWSDGSPQPGPPTLSRRVLLQRWAVAASVLAAAGVGAWLLIPGQEALASSDLLDQLLDWNLDLTRAQSAGERQRLHAKQATQLAAAIQRASLPGEEAALAASLLENGAWLTASTYPSAEAVRFDALADRLLKLASAAQDRGDSKALNRYLRQYGRAVEAGVNLNWQRAEASGALDLERQHRLEHVILSDAARLRQLETLLETSPQASRKEIRRALGIHHRHRKRKPAGK